MIFQGNNGSVARFDSINEKPESILGKTPDPAKFIQGATHWYTIQDGKFTGKLGGEEF